MRRVVLISPDQIAEKMAGPGIRYWNIAKALAKKFEVTLFIPNKWEPPRDINFKVKFLTIDSLKVEMLNAKAVMFQGLTLFHYPFLKDYDVPLIVDIYDPFMLESLEARRTLPEQNKMAMHVNDLRIVHDQLTFGDFFLCASEKQLDFWIGMLTAYNRVNPATYELDNTLNKLIDIVPFGLPSEKPTNDKKVLKGVYKTIKDTDKVLLWGGGIWNWFDPLTLIKAVKLISEERDDVKLFFMGIRHPNPDIQEMEMTRKAIQLSKDLNLYDSFVFFNEWVPYEERHNYLLEADIGVSTHFNHVETRYSFRTRILDYFWTSLPIVATKGDTLADLIESKSLGITVNPCDEIELKDAILKLLNDVELYNSIKQRLEKTSRDFTWEYVIKPIETFCENPYKQPDWLLHKKENKPPSMLSKFLFYLPKWRNIFQKGGMRKFLRALRNILD